MVASSSNYSGGKAKQAKDYLSSDVSSPVPANPRHMLGEAPSCDSPAAHSSSGKRKATDSPLSHMRSPHHDFKGTPKSKTPVVKKVRNFREAEKLTIRLNIYDLVWDKERGSSNAGLVDIGLGFYHTGLELWGKELSFGHSKRFKSGVFAVKPKQADELMPHTVFRESIEMDTIFISRYSVDKILNRMSAKYTSDAYNVVRNNCNHFTEELCQALCGKNIPEWVNRPAKMGSSTLDVLNAPFEAISSVMKVFTPSKKENIITATNLDSASRLAKGRGLALLAEKEGGPTARQLEMVGSIPEDAEQIGRASRSDVVPLLTSPPGKA